MSFTSEVSAFIETLGPFYEPVDEDEENQTSIRLKSSSSSKNYGKLNENTKLSVKLFMKM